MRIPLYRLVRKDAPREGVINYWTHAAGTAAILLIIPSACAFYLRHLGIEDHEPSWVRTAHGIWYTHIGLTALTLMLWLVERPRAVKFATTEADLVQWPEAQAPAPPPQSKPHSR
ncbi:MAG: hypothetical protein JSS11_11065 [Verrucomicrobia bacterium]|nr:hypothetical protein [Verrucomicrobiota bacterium]